jgi:hypothetical protein
VSRLSIETVGIDRAVAEVGGVHISDHESQTASAPSSVGLAVG